MRFHRSDLQDQNKRKNVRKEAKEEKRRSRSCEFLEVILETAL